MAWGWKSADTRPELERIAAEISTEYFAMPPEHREQAVATIRGMLAIGGGLRVLTDGFVSAVVRGVMRVVAELKTPFTRKPTPRELVEQFARGAAPLLADVGTTEDDLQRLVGD